MDIDFLPISIEVLWNLPYAHWYYRVPVMPIYSIISLFSIKMV